MTTHLLNLPLRNYSWTLCAAVAFATPLFGADLAKAESRHFDATGTFLPPLEEVGGAKCGCGGEAPLAFVSTTTKTRAKGKGAKSPGKESPSVDQQVKSIVASMQQLPPAPKAGECYVRVVAPAKYKTVQERVLVKPEVRRFVAVPAVFKDVEKSVLTRPETKRYEVIPAKFEKKKVAVVITPEHTKWSTTDPVLGKKTGSVMTQPETVAWKQGEKPLAQLKDVMGNIWCLVREPAKAKEYAYATITRKATKKEEAIDAAKQMVDTMVMVKPAEVKEIVEPAQYKKFKVRQLVTPATTKEVVEKPVFQMIDRKVLVEPEHFVWRRVLCETNITPPVIRKIQQALKKKGLKTAVNGKLDEATIAAINKYQVDNKLASGALTYETLEHLKIDL